MRIECKKVKANCKECYETKVFQNGIMYSWKLDDTLGEAIQTTTKHIERSIDET